MLHMNLFERERLALIVVMMNVNINISNVLKFDSSDRVTNNFKSMTFLCYYTFVRNSINVINL